MNRYFSREVVQTDSQQMKGCSALVVTRELQKQTHSDLAHGPQQNAASVAITRVVLVC